MRSARSGKYAGLVLGFLATFPADLAAAATLEDGPDCPVTRPNGQGFVSQSIRLSHGNEWLATRIPVDGKVTFRPKGAGCIDADGALWIKWPWWRKASGTLEIETGTLDGGGEALRAKVPCCYGQSGFQVSGLGFPGAGCWKVTARVGEGSLSFVTLVEKIGEGPPACEARVTSPINEMQRTKPAQATERR